jgi:hypothetical protein
VERKIFARVSISEVNEDLNYTSVTQENYDGLYRRLQMLKPADHNIASVQKDRSF